MTTDALTAAREQLLEEWAVAFSTLDIPRVLAMFTDDVLYEDVAFGAVNQGKAALQAWLEGFGANSPGRFELTSTFVSGDRGVLEWVASGTHDSDLPGMPATGKPFRFRGCTVVEFAGTQIKRNSDYWDFATMLRQLGFLPEAVEASS